MPNVKTAISMPAQLFRDAERLCKQLKLSRSEFISNAVDAYVRRYRAEEMVALLDRVYSGPDTEEERNVKAAAKRRQRKLAEGTW